MASHCGFLWSSVSPSGHQYSCWVSIITINTSGSRWIGDDRSNQVVRWWPVYAASYRWTPFCTSWYHRCPLIFCVSRGFIKVMQDCPSTGHSSISGAFFAWTFEDQSVLRRPVKPHQHTNRARTQVLLPSIVDMVCQNEWGTLTAAASIPTKNHGPMLIPGARTLSPFEVREAQKGQPKKLYFRSKGIFPEMAPFS